MEYVCVSSQAWPIDEGCAAELAADLLEFTPRAVVERRGVVWADARGLPAQSLAEEVRGRVEAVLGAAEPARDVAGAGGSTGIVVGVGVATVPVVAECAARRVLERAVSASDDEVVERGVELVSPGTERSYLEPLPLSFLTTDTRLLGLLGGVGIQRCGELAALDQEAVEVRFGTRCVEVWQLARAEDRRILFAPVPRERPHASIDFIDYTVRDPERLLFTVNALLGQIVEVLTTRGEHARQMTFTLPLADGEEWRQVLRPARPTASRERWLRLARAVLERASFPDAVTGAVLEARALEPATVRQGDLFDHGFATAGAAEAVLERLIEEQGEVLVRPEGSGHPLPERRAAWVRHRRGDAEVGYDTTRRREGVAAEIETSDVGPEHPVVRDPRARGAGEEAVLTLQLLPEARRIEVEVSPPGSLGSTGPAHRPVRFRYGRRWVRLATVAAPERLSGGQWEEPYAREYFRAVTETGTLLWLYRDARADEWYLQGWWD